MSHAVPTNSEDDCHLPCIPARCDEKLLTYYGHKTLCASLPRHMLQAGASLDQKSWGGHMLFKKC